jgi:hypothetical protein
MVFYYLSKHWTCCICPKAYLRVDCITGVNSLNPKPLILIRTWVLISNIELLLFFLIDVHISIFDAKPSWLIFGSWGKIVKLKYLTTFVIASFHSTWTTSKISLNFNKNAIHSIKLCLHLQRKWHLEWCKWLSDGRVSVFASSTFPELETYHYLLPWSCDFFNFLKHNSRPDLTSSLAEGQ